MNGLRRTRYLVELQGYCGLADRSVAALDPWLRVAPAVCAGWAAVATIGGSTGALAILGGIAALGAALPLHPFDIPYNFVVRHWTGTPPIPASGVPRRFACGVATLWLAVTAGAFAAGAVYTGIVLGAAFTVTAMVPVVTGLCVPSWFLSQLLHGRGTARTSSRRQSTPLQS